MQVHRKGATSNFSVLKKIEINITLNWTLNELFIRLFVIPNLYIHPPPTARAAWPQLAGLTLKVLVLMLGNENVKCFADLSQGSTGTWVAVLVLTVNPCSRN